MRIFNVGNNGVNLFLLDSGSHRLLIDSGFPDKLHDLGRRMRETGFKVQNIDYLVVTHFHIDHAGAIQELKDSGVKFVLFDMQMNYISGMEKMMEGKWPYKKLLMNDNVVLNIDKSRYFLSTLGIKGQIFPTPGHSDDSVSLLLDTGEAFTGDLTADYLMMGKNSVENQTWTNLKKQNARIIYPSHGKMYEIKDAYTSSE